MTPRGIIESMSVEVKDELLIALYNDAQSAADHGLVLREAMREFITTMAIQEKKNEFAIGFKFRS